jgi:hypothetical protein
VALGGRIFGPDTVRVMSSRAAWLAVTYAAHESLADLHDRLEIWENEGGAGGGGGS